MAQSIANSQLVRGATTLAALLLVTLALGGCQSPMYSGTPDDMSVQERSYIGRNEHADQQQPTEELWTAEQRYEYRGGRDPVTGRANRQM